MFEKFHKICDNDTFILENNKTITCDLCPIQCNIVTGSKGKCLSRANVGGKLEIINYGQIISCVVDTLKNRPIYDWNKTKNIKSLSIGLAGCNNKCPFCLNYQVSQSLSFQSKFYSPSKIVETALEKEVGFISFTFTEPIVWFEYMRDVAEIAKKNNILICLKTAGYVSEKHINKILNFVDVVNLDIKPLDINYLKTCGIEDNDIVINFAKECIKKNIHLEISHIVIEGVNSNLEEINKFCDIINSLESEVSVHLLRHYPAWISKYPLTSDKTLKYFENNFIKKCTNKIYNREVG